MRPKARGLAQHGGPPGWLEESDPSGGILPRIKVATLTRRKSCLTVLLPQAMHLLAFEISKWEFVRHFDPISAAAMLLQLNAVVQYAM